MNVEEEKPCYLCMRIDGAEFYKELRELDFEIDEVGEITNWVKEIYSSDPTLLCGKSVKVIKAALAYVGILKYYSIDSSNKFLTYQKYTVAQKTLFKKFNCASFRLPLKKILACMISHNILKLTDFDAAKNTGHVKYLVNGLLKNKLYCDYRNKSLFWKDVEGNITFLYP